MFNTKEEGCIMNFQYHVNNQVLKKIKWALIILILLLGFFTFFTFANNNFNTNIILTNFIAVPSQNFFNTLFLYQFFVNFFIAYYFYFYEIHHSFENVVLRFNPRKWLITKIITLSYVIILVRTTIFIFTYLIYHNHCEITMYHFISSLSYFLMISYISIIIFNLFKGYSLVKFFLIFILALIINYHFSLWLMLIILILLIFEIRFFNFKKL